MAEGGGLLNRYRGLNLYRGFESPPLRIFKIPCEGIFFYRYRFPKRHEAFSKMCCLSDIHSKLYYKDYAFSLVL